MKKKKNNLTLEDFQQEFSYKDNKGLINVSFNRVAFIFFIFLIIAIIFSLKATFYGFTKVNKKKIYSPNKDYRSTIFDRNGNILAKSVNTINAGINPKLVIDKKKLLLNLKIIFPNKDLNFIKEKLNKKKFFYIEKQITQAKLERLILLGDKSIITEEKISRIYPQSNLFSHIIGQIDDGNNGISGIEKYFDYELRTSKNPIQLTIDTDIQYLVREELVKAKEIF